MAPPYTTGKTYFTNDAKAWKATRPPAWTTGMSQYVVSRVSADILPEAQMNTTVDTIWSGDAALRNYYNTLAVARPRPSQDFRLICQRYRSILIWQSIEQLQ